MFERKKSILQSVICLGAGSTPTLIHVGKIFNLRVSFICHCQGVLPLLRKNFKHSCDQGESNSRLDTTTFSTFLYKISLMRKVRVSQGKVKFKPPSATKCCGESINVLISICKSLFSIHSIFINSNLLVSKNFTLNTNFKDLEASFSRIYPIILP